MLPNPLLLSLPLSVWGGLMLFILIILQILTGLRWIKVPFQVHTKILWRIILILAVIHGIYGLQRYF